MNSLILSALLFNSLTVESPHLYQQNPPEAFESQVFNEICGAKLEEILENFRSSPISLREGVYSLTNPISGFEYTVFFNEDEPNTVGISREISESSYLEPLQRNRAPRLWVYDRSNNVSYEISSSSEVIEVEVCDLTRDIWKNLKINSTL